MRSQPYDYNDKHLSRTPQVGWQDAHMTDESFRVLSLGVSRSMNRNKAIRTLKREFSELAGASFS